MESDICPVKMAGTRRSRRWHGARAGVIGVLTVLGLAAAAGPAASQAWRGKEETREGVIWVLNPAEPVSEPVVVTANEIWRAGGEGDDEILFGVISQITTDTKGNIYLLDSQLNQVMVFSPNGEHVRAIGRSGEGPGEFQRPSDLFLTADGNVAVMQRMPGRVVLLTPEGEPLGNMPSARGARRRDADVLRREARRRQRRLEHEPLRAAR